MDNHPIDKGKKVEDSQSEGQPEGPKPEGPKPEGPTPEEPQPQQQQQPSVFSRIARSAAGLGRDAVAGLPRGQDLAGLGSDKAGSSGSARASASEQADTLTRHAQPGPALPTFAPPSFATGHSQQHIAAQEEAFAQFLDGADIDTSIPSDLPGMESIPGGTGAGAGASAGASTSLLSRETPPPTFSAAVVIQESRDGQDVVQLLAGPSEDEPDYLRDIELAEDEVAGLQRVLFGQADPDTDTATASSTSTPTPWDHMLNFIPAFLRPRPDTEPGTASHPSHMSHTHETRTLLGVDDAPEATRQWLEQWRGVLTRYDDEVWGGLAPLVAEARQEMEQLAAAPDTAAQGSAQTKALNRLRQILGHLQGS